MMRVCHTESRAVDTYYWETDSSQAPLIPVGLTGEGDKAEFDDTLGFLMPNCK
jgi:hypothetical protein